VVPEVSAGDVQRRSDDAVRRIREESARRGQRAGRVRAFSSWCALATLAGAISLAALEAHNERIREEVRRSPPTREAEIWNACAPLSAALAASDKRLSEELQRAKTLEEKMSAQARRGAVWKEVLQVARVRCPTLVPSYYEDEPCGGAE